MTSCSSTCRLADCMVSVSLLFHSPLPLTSRFAALHLSKGLPLVSMGEWLVASLIIPCMKCCPFSTLAMIGHAPSVKRLYPSVGKHDLHEASTTFGLFDWTGYRIRVTGKGGASWAFSSTDCRFACCGFALLPLCLPCAPTCLFFSMPINCEIHIFGQ